jgi:glycine hydroxymethyltransferase
MTTTHKTLRGPRGAMLMVTDRGHEKDPELADKIDRAVFPGLQGGPHDHTTAAIAVALLEASKPSFKTYAKQIVTNAKVLAKELLKYDFNLVSGGTDNHLLLIDLTNKKVNGAVAALALEVAGIVVNKNAVPNDPMPPFYPSGIRLGTPAITTRGMKEREMVKIAAWINMVIEEASNQVLPNDNGFDKLTMREKRKEFFKEFRSEIYKNKKLLAIAGEIKNLCSKFPVP